MILVPSAMEQAIRILEERLESETREHVRYALEKALAAMRKQIYYVVLRSEERLYEAECGSSVARSLIKRCCDGAQGKSHGFIWRFVE